MLSAIKKKLQPDTSILAQANRLIDALNALLSKKQIKAHAILGGSVAKNTYLTAPDCDIFVCFELSEKDKDISSVLGSAIKDWKAQKIHGSRDYYRYKQGKVIFELVPVLKISHADQAQNVTDMSPLHIQWVRRNAKGLEDDIRLAKLFCKANNVYGAESYINGFSGYMLEVLVVYYKGFLPLISNAAKWKPKVAIDINKEYDGKDIHSTMNEQKISGPLILIDPTDPKRNVASALGQERFSEFVYAAKSFIASPSKKFFTLREPSIPELKKKAAKAGVDLILLWFTPKSENRDIAGCKIQKCVEHIKKHILLHEFSLLDFNWWYFEEEALAWFFVHRETLPALQKKHGPPVSANPEDVSRFSAKHKEVWVEDTALVAYDKRRYKKVRELIPDLIKDPWIKEKAGVEWKQGK